MDVDPKAIDGAGRALVAQLEGEGFAAATVSTRSCDGPAGTTLVTAASAGAYPGTGVHTALVDGGTIYGPGAGLAELARARGWLTTPPDSATLATIASYLLFDGLLQIDSDGGAPAITPVGGGWRLDLVRRTFPSGARERVAITVGASGPASLQIEDAAAPVNAPIPIDRATALTRALDAGDLPSTMAAIAALAHPASPRELAALARAATHPNDTVAADALLALGGSDAAALALRTALATVDGARRSAVVGMAQELWGDAFAGSLAQ